jgi:transcriptional regulator with XRE-family HTH domain
MKFPNLEWSIAQAGSQFRFAASLGESESWLSRRLTGRTPFSAEERVRIAAKLGYPERWLFQAGGPPTDGGVNETREEGVIS